jgi:cation-transporting P-type ATPase 13A2
MAALRAATVGVSLCEAETSVAAPITSRLQTPGAVVEVIKEGRCSLITAYVLVAFNIMYGTIQLFMAIMMYNYGLELGNNTYLVQDLFYTLVLGLAISITPPCDVLKTEHPPQRFFTKYFCFKLFSQLICFPVFQLIGLAALRRQDWYTKYDFGDDPLSETYAYETSVIASLGLAQVMIASVVSTIDEPFRKPWYTNKYHVSALVVQGGFLAYQIFGRSSYFIKEILEVRPLKIEFCWILVLIILANCVVSGFLSWVADLIKHISQQRA